MICTFCGTENPQGNRFCGVCGVRLERRRQERRIHERGSTTCSECGHDNEPNFKFCGMCGARIDRRIQDRRAVGEVHRATAVANAQLPPPDRQRAATLPLAEARTTTMTVVTSPAEFRPQPSRGDNGSAMREIHPTVSGPSFLGLNDAANTDYLLEEEKSSHRGLRALLLLIVLAAIAGLVIVQYRSTAKGVPKSPTPPDPSPATIPNSEGKNATPGNSQSKDKAMALAAGAHSLQPAVAEVAKAAASTSSSELAAKQDGGDDNHKIAKKAAESPPRTEAPAADDDPPSPSLVKAQQYIHGQGVRQNCEQGLIYLRAAARENDPRAAVQMGALYSSGLCVPHDRVRAYEWFSTARDMQPNNQWISKNMTELWAQMSPQERQKIHR